MPSRTQGVPEPISRFVAQIDAEVYLREQVAESLGVSTSTLVRVGKAHPELAASYKTAYGKRWLFLYSPQDVSALEAYLREHLTSKGRPTLWSREERKQRQGRQYQVRYLRLKAVECAAAGRPELAADYRRREQVIKQALTAEYAVRFAERTRPRVRR